MVPLGLKETKDIDFFEQFSDFILEHYSVDPSNFEDAILDLIDTRQVRGVFNVFSAHTVSLTNDCLRLRGRQRETRTAWICCVNITTFCIMPNEDSSPPTAILDCISSGMTH